MAHHTLTKKWAQGMYVICTWVLLNLHIQHAIVQDDILYTADEQLPCIVPLSIRQVPTFHFSQNIYIYLPTYMTYATYDDS